MTETITQSDILDRIPRIVQRMQPAVHACDPDDTTCLYSVDVRAPKCAVDYCGIGVFRPKTMLEHDRFVGRPVIQTLNSVYDSFNYEAMLSRERELAAFLAFFQELLSSHWAFSAITDEESTLSLDYASFLSRLEDDYGDIELRVWAEYANKLAQQYLQGKIEAPKKNFDPEEEGEWWWAIEAHCQGDVDKISDDYDRLIERFVEAIPASARNRIRIEIKIEE